MKPRTWKVVAAVVAAVAGLAALALQASASAAGRGATTSALPPAPAAALPFPPDTETVFNPINPMRILDTRTSLGGHPGKISSGAPFNLKVFSEVVPPEARAVAFNVTVVAPTVSSFLTIWPKGTARPTFDNLSYAAGKTVTSSSMVRLSNDGQMTIKPAAGSTHVLIDIAGYYSRSTAWGQEEYVAWVVASDVTAYAAHSNNGAPIELKARNGVGDRAFRFHGANIQTFPIPNAIASIQVSVIGPAGSACFTSSTSPANFPVTDLEVRVVCLHTKDLTPVSATFYLQVGG